MWKKMLCVGLLLATSNAFAFDNLSSIPEGNRKVLDSVIKELGLPKISAATRKDIYDAMDYAFKDGWYSYWIGNGDLEKSKFKKSKTRIYELIIPSNERTNCITFTYFPEAKQIFYVQRQFIEGSSDNVMTAFREKDKDKDYKKMNETDNYAFFHKNGVVSFEVYHAKSPNGGASYFDYGLIDVK